MLNDNLETSSIKSFRTPIKRKGFIIGTFFAILIPLISFLLLFYIGNNEKISTTEINQNFHQNNYADGVKIMEFYQKDGELFATLDDKSTYFVCMFPKTHTFETVEKEIEILYECYGYRFLEDFLKDWKGFEFD